MKRLPMRKIRETLRLRADGLSGRQMALSLSLGRATVSDYLHRADVAGLSWPLPADLSDGDIEGLLFPRTAGDVCGSYPQPDWAFMHGELRRKGVTLSLLWEEYRAVHPNGYGYSRFCELYTRWEGKLSPVMRQRHPAGERLFVDYAGATMDVVCPQTGEVRTAQLFVATLGASSYTYVEASWTQSLPDWISSHVRAFGFFGGVPAQVVSDNLKAGVTKACFYEPSVPIRLSPTPTTSRVLPIAQVKLGVSGSGDIASNLGGTGRAIREKSLELRKRPRKRKVFTLRDIHPRFVPLPGHATPRHTYSECR